MSVRVTGWVLMLLFGGQAAAQDAPIDANTLSLDSTGTGFLSTGNGTVLERGQLHMMTAFHHLDSPVVWSTVDTQERVAGPDGLRWPLVIANTVDQILGLPRGPR